MKEKIKIVRQSYGRCMNDTTFFDKFYERFLASSPEIPVKFANTDFVKQKAVISKGINMMIMYAGGDNLVADNVISRLTESHSAAHLDIAPRLYGLWKRALIETVIEVDRQCTDEVSEAWGQVLDVGIQTITAGYNRGMSRRSA